MKKEDPYRKSTPCPRQRGICRGPVLPSGKISPLRPIVPSPLRPLLLSFFLLLTLKPSAQTIPEGYILQFKQDFAKPASLSDFWFSRDSVWSRPVVKGNPFLQGAVPEDSDTVSAPGNRAVIRDRIFGDFILETDIRLPEEPGAGVFFLLGVKDSTKYYFIRLSADSTVTPGIFLVKNGRVTRLPLRISAPAPLSAGVWQKIRIERNIVKRTIRVYAGNLAQPVMETKDYELVMGYIGFAATGGSVGFDNVVVWSQTVLGESE